MAYCVAKWYIAQETEQHLILLPDLGPVLKNVTFRNIDENPTNLENATFPGNIHFEFS